MSDATQAVTYEQIARRFGLDAPPPAWTDHVDPALLRQPAAATPGVFEPAAIAERARWVGVDDQGCELVASAARTIAASPVLRAAAALLSHLLFDVPCTVRLDANAVPLPASAPEGEAVRLFYAVLFLSRVDDLRARHERLEVDPEDTRRLLGDIGLWISEHRRRYGEWALSEVLWLRRHFHLQIFQVGRLQYEFEDFAWPFEVWRSRRSGRAVVLVDGEHQVRTDGRFADADSTSVFPPTDQENPNTGSRHAFTTRAPATNAHVTGHAVTADGLIQEEPVQLPLPEWALVVCPEDPVLAVHIAASGPLVLDEVKLSLQDAVRFFADRYPAYRARAFTCDSWLLDPQLKPYLNAESNIMRFQRLFLPVPLPGADDRQHLERVFPEWRAAIDRGTLDRSALDSAPQTTTIERATVAHIRDGRAWRIGGGIIPLPLAFVEI